ncbi:hypothetical protein FHX56_003678 [Paraburkholderia tropica]|nr:hypothetical protein [Paraburkholderia tropica]
MCRENGFGIGKLFEHARTGGVERGAFIGQRETARGAREQLAIQARFQPGDGFADGRCREIEAVGGGGKTA